MNPGRTSVPGRPSDPVDASNKVQISSRVRNVRDSWSPNERRQRAIEGRRRFEQFIKLIDLPGNDTEIWAAGALTTADFERITQSS